MTNLSILFTFAGSNTASGLKSMADFNLGWFIRLLYLFLFAPQYFLSITFSGFPPKGFLLRIFSSVFPKHYLLEIPS